jgi:ribonuclease P protein component
LFRGGRSFAHYPFRVYWALNPGPAEEAGSAGESVLQFGAGVSKRHFKKAVDRNRIKRLIREAYRTQKLPLQDGIKESSKGYLKLFILFTGKELPEYQLVREKVAAVLRRLEKEVGVAKQGLGTGD